MKGSDMSIGKTWFTVEEAAKKFGVAPERIHAWVAQGLIRSEEAGGKVMRLNGDDLALKLEELTGT